MDAVLRRSAVPDQVRPEARSSQSRWIVGSGSQIAGTRSRHDSSANTRASMAIGLAGQRRQTLGPNACGDQTSPGVVFQRVVPEPPQFVDSMTPAPRTPCMPARRAIRAARPRRAAKPTPRRPRPPATIRQTSVLRLRSAQRAQRLGWHLVDLTRLSSTASSSPWSRAHAREVGADEAGSAGYDPPREVRREVFLRRRQEDAGRALGVSSPRSTSPGGLADTLVACWTLLTMRV